MSSINISAPSQNPIKATPDRISVVGNVSSHDGKKAAVYLVSAKADEKATLKRRPRRDLVAARDDARKSMLHMAGLYFDILERTMFRPVDRRAERGLFERAPEDRQAMRIRQSVLAEFQALRQQMMNFVRIAPIVRGPGNCQSLQLVTEVCAETKTN